MEKYQNLLPAISCSIKLHQALAAPAFCSGGIQKVVPKSELLKKFHASAKGKDIIAKNTAPPGYGVSNIGFNPVSKERRIE